MTLARPSTVVAAIVIAFGIAAACSCDDPTPVGPKGDCILPTTSNFVDSAQGRVVIVGNSFNPTSITVRKGMSVKWIYCERANSDPHTVTSDAGLWDSGLLTSGATFSRAFPTVGSFAYHCIPHPEMQAAVTVVD